MRARVDHRACARVCASADDDDDDDDDDGSVVDAKEMDSARKRDKSVSRIARVFDPSNAIVERNSPSDSELSTTWPCYCPNFLPFLRDDPVASRRGKTAETPRIEERVERLRNAACCNYH